MSNVLQFTDYQVQVLNENIFTHNATNLRIVFTLEFKKFFMSQFEQGVHPRDILINAGYNPEWFGMTRIYNLKKRIIKETQSEGGLKAPKGLSTSEKLAAEKLSADKLSEEQSIAALQNRVEHLERQIEFLKKTAAIRRRYQKNPHSD